MATTLSYTASPVATSSYSLSHHFLAPQRRTNNGASSISRSKRPKALSISSQRPTVSSTAVLKTPRTPRSAQRGSMHARQQSLDTDLVAKLLPHSENSAPSNGLLTGPLKRTFHVPPRRNSSAAVLGELNLDVNPPPLLRSTVILPTWSPRDMTEFGNSISAKPQTQAAIDSGNLMVLYLQNCRKALDEAQLSFIRNPRFGPIVSSCQSLGRVLLDLEQTLTHVSFQHDPDPKVDKLLAGIDRVIRKICSTLGDICNAPLGYSSYEGTLRLQEQKLIELAASLKTYS